MNIDAFNRIPILISDQRYKRMFEWFTRYPALVIGFKQKLSGLTSGSFYLQTLFQFFLIRLLYFNLGCLSAGLSVKFPVEPGMTVCVRDGFCLADSAPAFDHLDTEGGIFHRLVMIIRYPDR